MSEAFELRQAVAADAAAIRELTRRAYAKWVPVVGREPKPMLADYDAAMLKHRFDLLYVDGALTGTMRGLRFKPSPAAPPLVPGADRARGGA